MADNDRMLSRRRVIALVVAAPLPFVVACSDSEEPAPTPTSAGGADNEPGGGGAAAPTAMATATATSVSAATLTPTPQCTDEDDEPTVAQTEGPFFTPATPERTSLIEAGMSGIRLRLTGDVVSTGCVPVASALLEFWQCDDSGEYDNVGYRLRGHQFADSKGQYSLETIVPGLYPGRTRHIHVKVQAPNRPVLTTQIYFPDEPRNASDRIFHDSLVMELGDGPDGKVGLFRFVLDV